MIVATATPAEIDTELARLDGELHKAEAKLVSAVSSLHYRVGDRKNRRGDWGMSDADAKATAEKLGETDETYVGAEARMALKSLQAAAKVIADLKAQANVYHAEYARRPWTRAFLAITNGNGHVHSSMSCSTCNNGRTRTMFGWQPEYSGADEAAIIADAGYRACTVCYPNAPVEATPESHPTKMFSQDEKDAAKAREERAAAKAARDAKRIANALTSDGSELIIRTAKTHESFKTEVAGRNWLVNELGSHVGFGYSKDDEAIAIVLEALATKHGVTVEQEREAIDVKVKAWIKRNS